MNIFSAGLLMILLGCAANAQETEQFSVTVTATNYPDAVVGSGTVWLTGNRMTCFVTSPSYYSYAAIHGPAVTNQNAPQLFGIGTFGCAADSDCAYSGEFLLSNQQADQLRAGLWYVLLGNDRGQIGSRRDCRFVATNEVAFHSFVDGYNPTNRRPLYLRFGRATFGLTGDIFSYEITMPAQFGPYGAFIRYNGGRDGSIIALFGTLECGPVPSTNPPAGAADLEFLPPCVIRGAICVPRDLILSGGCAFYLGPPEYPQQEWASIVPDDTDRDGVPDYLDRCPNTPPNSAVDQQGCSVDQLCPCESPWKNHAEYVKCVGDVTTRFATNGWISVDQASRALKLAITHDCGKKGGAFFSLSLPFQPVSDLPDDAWICTYWPFYIELPGTNQVPPVHPEIPIAAWVYVDFCFHPKDEWPSAGALRVYIVNPQYFPRIEIHGPAVRGGPKVKLLDVQYGCATWPDQVCADLTDQQLRDVLNGRYWLQLYSDDIPGGVLYAPIAVPDGDRDGVSDIFDACLTSPPGAIVNDHGCRIEDVCPCEAQWINHGEYVRCVETTANDFQQSGIISGAEKQRLVKAAQDSDCGKMRR